MIESLEKMLAKGVDNALLRFGLGKGYLDLGENAKAAEHFQRCVEFDPKYSAAWKLLGKAHLGLKDFASARQAWEHGHFLFGLLVAMGASGFQALLPGLARGRNVRQCQMGLAQ